MAEYQLRADMERVIEHHNLAASLIFNLLDSYARSRLGPRSMPRPYEPLRFFLLARLLPEPREDYTPPRELAIIRNPSGYHLFFGEELLPSQARNRGQGKGHARRRLELRPGSYLVRITSPFYQTEERNLLLPVPNLNSSDPGNPDPALRDPMAQYTFAMRPGYAYPFPERYSLRIDHPDDCPDPPLIKRGPTLLTGSLYSTNGRGLLGARVHVPQLTESYSIDASGQWLLWFPEPPANGNDPLGAGQLTVRFTLPGNPPRNVDVANVCVLRGASTSLNQATLRGWVLDHGVGVASATISISGYIQTISTANDGTWSYCFDLNQPGQSVNVTATLPDGRSKTQSAIEIRPRATVVVPSFIFSDRL